MRISPTSDLWHARGVHVEENHPRHEALAQLKEAVQGQGGHVWLRPPITTLLHILLKLDPPGVGVSEDVGVDVGVGVVMVVGTRFGLVGLY